MSTVYAAFDSRQAVTAAIQQLQQFGFAQASIRCDVDDKLSDASSLKDDHGFFSKVEHLLAKLGNSQRKLPSKLFEQTIRRGGAVLSVDTDTATEEQTARELLRNSGAIDLENLSRTHEAAISDPGNHYVAPKDIELSDRTVAVGGLPLHKYSDAGEPLGPIASMADFGSFQSGIFEIREKVDVITLAKQVRVVEEITVNKSVTVYAETIEDTLRQTSVDVERIAPAPPDAPHYPT